MGSDSNSSPKGTSSVPVLVAGSGPRGAVTVCISLKKHLLKSFKFMVLVIDSKYRKSPLQKDSLTCCLSLQSAWPGLYSDSVPDVLGQASLLRRAVVLPWAPESNHVSQALWGMQNQLLICCPSCGKMTVVCDIEVRGLIENVRINNVIYDKLFSHWVSPSLPR